MQAVKLVSSPEFSYAYDRRKSSGSGSTSSSDSLLMVGSLQMEIHKQTVRLDRIVAGMTSSSFSLGNPPPDYRMSDKIRKVYREIRVSRHFMMHAYHIDRLEDAYIKSQVSEEYITKGYKEIREYIAKLIQFYEWCSQQDIIE